MSGFAGARGANLWLRNSKGDLPLHEAVASGRRELVKWLLDGRPSQVNATNHEGRTPLHIAAATDNADLCRLLLDRGAEVNPVARSSKNDPLTPLDCATSRGHRSTAKYLQMHGGLPASKLANTEIVIDGAPITALPTRRVTSTKIDVHDRIRIEKREVVELSSPVQERRRLKDRNDSDSSNESSADNRKLTRRKAESNKYSDKHKERRKRLMHTQKSFSDGYDSEVDGYEKDHSREQRQKTSKKNRSRSEPSRRHKRSPKHHRRYRSRSDSTSESDTYSEKKKYKRHHKRSKRISSSPSESSSTESSERRSTKRKGKKTSIHIENDDEKQSVNIIKYKSIDSSQGNDRHETVATPIDTKTSETIKSEPDKEENNIVKSVAQSETETDTLSVKTNMVITEAQIHMERQSSQHGSSELNVIVDAANNVSIETSNLSVTHKDLTEQTKTDDENVDDDKTEIKESLEENETSQKNVDAEPAQILDDSSNAEKQELSNEENKTQSKTLAEQSSEQNKISDEQTKTQTAETQDDEENIGKSEAKETETSEHVKQPSKDVSESADNDLKATLSSNGELGRRKSFQILSGPDETSGQSKEGSGDLKTSLDAPSIEQTETQGKTTSPAVSFSNKDEIIESKDSKLKADNLMGESVDHSLDPETDKQVQDSILQKDSSESNVMSSEEKRKDYASATGSSTENTHSLDKGLVGVLDDNMDTSDRAVQQVILENVSGDYDVNLSLSQTPKRTRKTSKESQGSSRKSSIYETESYKVLSDIASAPDVSTGILKKTGSVRQDEGSIEDDREFIGVKLSKDGSYIGRVPSVSDNELYSHSEVDGRRKRFRKKGRTKSRTTIRSKSENSERGYESSGLMDSGFEPSPRALQRRITSPRLAAYYQQRNASGRYSGKSDSRIPVRKPGDKYAVDMKSVTQRIQTNMRRYVFTSG